MAYDPTIRDTANDGQHRSVPGSPQELQGMRTRMKPGVHVGQECGPELNMRVPATEKDADFYCDEKDEAGESGEY